MAYSATSGDPSNMGFLLGRLLDMISQVVTNASSDSVDLDAEALLLFEYASFYTYEDPKFREDWERIQKLRKAEYARLGIEQGDDARVDLGFRFQEVGATVRSLCRLHVLTRAETNKTGYEPMKSGAKAVVVH